MEISDKIAAKLRVRIEEAMDEYHYVQGDAYSCSFCQEERGPYDLTVQHRDDCEGLQFLVALIPNQDFSTFADSTVPPPSLPEPEHLQGCEGCSCFEGESEGEDR